MYVIYLCIIHLQYHRVRINFCAALWSSLRRSTSRKKYAYAVEVQHTSYEHQVNLLNGRRPSSYCRSLPAASRIPRRIFLLPSKVTFGSKDFEVGRYDCAFQADRLSRHFV